MEVHLFDRFEELDRVRESWNAAFARDQHASVFMSWPWMRAWLEVAPYKRWAVLAAREDGDSPWSGFLPINIRGNTRAYRMDQIREIHMAGDPVADYTGFVCEPQHEQAAIEAMADFIADRMHWERLQFKEINDPRIDWFIDRLPAHGMKRCNSQGMCCPYIELPTTWDDYLQQCLSYETRKSLRKKLKLIDKECQVTQLEADNHDQQIEALLTLASLREYHKDDRSIVQFRRTLHATALAGLARVLVIWHERTPIAGLAALVDDKHSSLCFYLTSFDDRFAQFSPGRVVNALMIRHAIEHHFKTLDFLRGDEAYKFQFGALRRHNRNFSAVRKGLQTAARMTINRTREKLRI